MALLLCFRLAIMIRQTEFFRVSGRRLCVKGMPYSPCEPCGFRLNRSKVTKKKQDRRRLTAKISFSVNYSPLCFHNEWREATDFAIAASLAIGLLLGGEWRASRQSFASTNTKNY